MKKKPKNLRQVNATDDHYFCMCDLLADAAGIDLYKLI